MLYYYPEIPRGHRAFWALFRREKGEFVVKSVLYRHKVQYYETDKMDCVHHSNYIRWFEEARTFLMDQGGFGYAAMERLGVMSPVLEVEAAYRSMARFGDTVEIETRLEAYTGTRVEFSYTVRDQETGEVRCQGKTRHCFLGPQGRPVSLRKACPAYHQKIAAFLEE